MEILNQRAVREPQRNEKMKRKAPETLLEFSDYILPLKRIKFAPSTPEEMDGPQQIIATYYGAYDLATENNSSYSPWESRSKDLLSDDLQPLGDGGIIIRSSVSSPSSSMHEHYFESIITDDSLAKKPASSKAPLDVFVEAIKWLIEEKRLVQREVANDLSVR